MIGSIIGDVVGSRFEFDNHLSKDFELFSKKCFYTDDTVMTVAGMEHLLTGESYHDLVKKYYFKYPKHSYGGRFRGWCESKQKTHDSFGNGAAMKISPAAFAGLRKEDGAAVETVCNMTKVTHGHHEGIKGALAVCAAIRMAFHGSTKKQIKTFIETECGYNLDMTVDGIRGNYWFDETCQQTVPQALTCFFESTSFEDALRNAISIGGDSDTIGAIVGGIAEAFYRDEAVPFALEVLGFINGDEGYLFKIIQKFYREFDDNNDWRGYLY